MSAAAAFDAVLQAEPTRRRSLNLAMVEGNRALTLLETFNEVEKATFRRTWAADSSVLSSTPHSVRSAPRDTAAPRPNSA